MDRKGACFSLHTIKGSSLQIGAARVAKATLTLEEQIGQGVTELAPRFKKLGAEFKRFVNVFEEYLAEECTSEIDAPRRHSLELVKSKSEEVAPNCPVCDKNLRNQSM